MIQNALKEAAKRKNGRRVRVRHTEAHTGKFKRYMHFASKCALFDLNAFHGKMLCTHCKTVANIRNHYPSNGIMCHRSHM